METMKGQKMKLEISYRRIVTVTKRGFTCIVAMYAPDGTRISFPENTISDFNRLNIWLTRRDISMIRNAYKRIPTVMEVN